MRTMSIFEPKSA